MKDKRALYLALCLLLTVLSIACTKANPKDLDMKPDLDSKKKIYRELGKPDYTYNLRNNVEVLFYQQEDDIYLFFFENGTYKVKTGTRHKLEDFKKMEREGTLENVLLKLFEYLSK